MLAVTRREYFLAGVVVFLGIYVLCMIAWSYQHTKYSYLYQEDFQCMKDEVEEHVRLSRAWITSHRASLKEEMRARSPSDVRLCIGITTTHRPNSPHFLSLTTASLLENLGPEGRESVYLYLVNTDNSPQLHADAYVWADILDVFTPYETQYNSLVEIDSNLKGQVALDLTHQNRYSAEYLRLNKVDVTPAVNRPPAFDKLAFNEPTGQFSQIMTSWNSLGRGSMMKEGGESEEELTRRINFLQKKKQLLDYTYTLDRCLQSGYDIEAVLVLEDDIMTTRDVYPKLLSLIEQLVSPSYSDWAFVKLWYTPYHLGWSSSLPDIFYVYGGSFSLGATIYFVLSVLCMRLTPPKRFLVALYVSFLFIIGCYMVGKQNIFPAVFESGLHPTTTRCCSPAHLYNIAWVKSLAAFFTQEFTRYLPAEVEPEPVDLLMDVFVEKNGLSKYILTPNLFQHIGIKSTFHRLGWDNPGFMWSEFFDGSLFQSCLPGYA